MALKPRAQAVTTIQSIPPSTSYPLHRSHTWGRISPQHPDLQQRPCTSIPSGASTATLGVSPRRAGAPLHVQEQVSTHARTRAHTR